MRLISNNPAKAGLKQDQARQPQTRRRLRQPTTPSPGRMMGRTSVSGTAAGVAYRKSSRAAHIRNRCSPRRSTRHSRLCGYCFEMGVMGTAPASAVSNTVNPAWGSPCRASSQQPATPAMRSAPMSSCVEAQGRGRTRSVLHGGALGSRMVMLFLARGDHEVLRRWQSSEWTGPWRACRARHGVQMAIVMPPSTTSTCPVMKAEASLARNTAVPARSCGVPQRFIGVRLRIHSYRAGSARKPVLMSVAI